MKCEKIANFIYSYKNKVYNFSLLLFITNYYLLYFNFFISLSFHQFNINHFIIYKKIVSIQFLKAI